MRRLERIAVESSSLASTGFEAEHNILEVEFRNGLVYEYFGVPQSVYQALLKATSKGAFMHRFIRDRYPHRQVDRPRSADLTQ